MPALFTSQQRKALERGLSECHACNETLALLAKMGLQNEAKEAENEMMMKAIQVALQHDDEQSQK